ncbi:MAG TPA: M20/M25/M40 family metallo-hydrolase, partial [Candidatus Absconditabacterales bacterium]|nr:M20/M25/M40 family metallo-hydrolase [Candidatus Absconditabacterales bacterium]
KLEIKKCAYWLSEIFKENNFDVEIIENYGNPIIKASFHLDENYKNGIIYGHYDIQSANKDDGRKGDPFDLLISKNKIIGRGVVDNKGQTLIHMVNIFKLIKEGKLNYNITFIIEGEEEIGSNGISKFVKEKGNNIRADFVLISDGNIIKNLPVIESGFRGGFSTEIKFKTANTDLHTGIYGGVIPNAIEELNKLLSKLYDTNNKITIPYFYYEVEDLSALQLSPNKKIPFDKNQLEENFQIKKLKLNDIDFYSKTGLQPCIEITGISGGKTNYFNNSIPNKAKANLNFRLVSKQKCDTIKSLFEERVKNNVPNYVNYELSFDKCNKAIKLNNENIFYEKAKTILEKVYKNKLINLYSGGSLPIIGVFQEHITNNILSIPLANQDCNMHGVNENFNTDLIDKGFEFSYNFFKK